MSKHTRTRLPEGTTQVRNASTGEVKQMSDIKMSEVFDLPITSESDYCDDFGDDHRVIQDSNYKDVISDDTQFSVDQVKAVVHAINNHDKLTSRVSELETALLSIKSREQNLTPSGFEFSSVWQIADKALSE